MDEQYGQDSIILPISDPRAEPPPLPSPPVNQRKPAPTQAPETPGDLTYLGESAQAEKIYAALSKAQGEIAEVKKDSEAEVQTRAGGSYSFSYLSLGALTRAVQKPMANNGLALIFSVAKIYGTTMVVGKLVHSSGQWIQVAHPFVVSEQDLQKMGSAKTYCRRYIIQDLFNIFADEDDDGNSAMGNNAKVNQKGPQMQRPPNMAPGGDKNARK